MKKNRETLGKKCWKLLRRHPVSAGIILTMVIMGLVYMEPGCMLLGIPLALPIAAFEWVLRRTITGLREGFREYKRLQQEIKDGKFQHSEHSYRHRARLV